MKANKFIEIKEKIDLEEAIEFAWDVTRRDEKAGYPEKTWEYEGLREEFIKAYNHKDDKMLLLRSGEDITGVVCLFVDKQDMYLQTIGGIYYKDDFEYVLNKFIEYLEKNFKNYEIIIGYTSKDKNILKVLEQKGEIFEKAEFFKLYKNNLKFKDIREDIRLLTTDDFEDFSDIHDKINSNMYWTSERLKEDLDNWRIFVYKESGKIKSYIMIRVYLDLTGEIFNITNVGILDQSIIEDLIYVGCKDMFDIGVTNIISSCDMDSYENDLYYKLGFERTNDYIGYNIKI